MEIFRTTKRSACHVVCNGHNIDEYKRLLVHCMTIHRVCFCSQVIQDDARLTSLYNFIQVSEELNALANH